MFSILATFTIDNPTFCIYPTANNLLSYKDKSPILSEANTPTRYCSDANVHANRLSLPHAGARSATTARRRVPLIQLNARWYKGYLDM